jgi:hypothetical protein
MTTLGQKQKQSSILKGIILSLMFIGFALKAVLPAGFMPDAKSGVVAMVVCSGMGEKTIYVPDDGNKDHAPKHEQKDYCPYQVLTQAKGFIDHAPQALPVTFHYINAAVVLSQVMVRTSWHTGFSARAPPLSII